MQYRKALVLGLMVVAALPLAAQAGKAQGQWYGTISTKVKASESGYKFEGVMSCDFKGNSARCTYSSTATYTGEKVSYTITEAATQEHLQVSLQHPQGEWKLLVGAFHTLGTKTITMNGKTQTANDVYVQQTNWEVPLGNVKDANKLHGTYTNPQGDVLEYDLSR